MSFSIRSVFISFAAIVGGLACVDGVALAADPVKPPSSFVGFFSAPVDCEAGRTCVIQQYVDVDGGAGWRDYRCGKASYDGHKGTDFRIMTAAAYQRGVRVVAAAAGRVLRVRNDAPDRLIKSAGDRARVRRAECGNGLVIDHGGGMVSQYCHLRQGSLAVRPGERVERGAALGVIGLSGMTQMPHLHISFRHRGEVVDPYLGLGRDGASGGASRLSCGASGAAPLWREDVLQDFPYRSSRLIEAGFIEAPIKAGAREVEAAGGRVDKRSPNLILFARVINFRVGDRLEMMVEGPQGFIVSRRYGPVSRQKARYLGLVGKRRRGAGWPAGVYRGIVKVMRDGRVHEERRVSLAID